MSGRARSSSRARMRSTASASVASLARRKSSRTPAARSVPGRRISPRPRSSRSGSTCLLSRKSEALCRSASSLRAPGPRWNGQLEERLLRSRIEGGRFSANSRAGRRDWCSADETIVPKGETPSWARARTGAWPAVLGATAGDGLPLATVISASFWSIKRGSEGAAGHASRLRGRTRACSSRRSAACVPCDFPWL